MNLLRLALLSLAAPAFCFAQASPCAAFHDAVKSTYNFKPSKLSNAEREKKSGEMDVVWDMVQAKPAVMLPCLVSELQAPSVDQFFLYDASALLAETEHSSYANTLLLRSCEVIDFADISLDDWIHRLTTLAWHDVDISTAAARWMSYDHATYSLPQHDFTAKKGDGAFFLYGSMKEDLATEALRKIASDPHHPEQELAFSLLGLLVTPAADAAMRSVDTSKFSVEARDRAKVMIDGRATFEPRTPPKSTREELLTVFHAITEKRDFRPFIEFTTNVPDGERDVVALMGRDDIPLLRNVRRAFAASGSPDLIEDYHFLGGIIWTIESR